MEGEINECCNCKHYEWYYDKQYGKYTKTAYGFCRRNKTVVMFDSCMGCCQLRRNLTSDRKSALTEIVAHLTEITDICKKLLDDEEGIKE